MQFHIHKKNSAPLGSSEPRGYSPLHEARPLDEIEEVELQISEETEEHGWRSSRRIPVMLFCAAILLFLGITYTAKEFQSEENLQGIIIEGNGSLLKSEVMSLAAINTKQKFYDIDLSSIERRIEKHGLVRHAELHRESHPNRIVIHIEEREPIAMIRSTSGEPILVDKEYRFFLPKRLSGLKDPDKLLSVPLLGGITEKDTAVILQMAKMIVMIRQAGEGAMHDAVGELRRTTTGAFVLYTAATMTPIFIGTPQDERFQTSLEVERKKLQGAEEPESLFESQIGLLASAWKNKIKDELFHNGALYIDARFAGEIILKRRGAYIPHPVMDADSTNTKTIAAAIR